MSLDLLAEGGGRHCCVLDGLASALDLLGEAIRPLGAILQAVSHDEGVWGELRRNGLLVDVAKRWQVAILRRDGEFIKESGDIYEPGYKATLMVLYQLDHFSMGKKPHQSREGEIGRGWRQSMYTEPDCMRVRSPPTGSSM